MTNAGALGTLACEWLDGRLARGELTKGSYVTERQSLALLCTMFAEPGDLDRAAVLAWQGAIGHLRPATRKGRASAVRRFLVWLAVEGHLEDDLSGHVAKVRVPRGAPRGLSDPEMAALLAACPTEPTGRGPTTMWLRPAVGLMRGCGLRCCEIANLDVDDYDRHNRTVHVVGKGGHARTLPVPPEVAAVVDQYLLDRGYAPGPLFCAVGSKANPDGRLSRQWISKRTRRAMTEAGVHKRPYDGRGAHALRHQAAHDAMEATDNVLVVQALLGHDSLATTQIYLPKVPLAQMRRAVEGRDWLAGLADAG